MSLRIDCIHATITNVWVIRGEGVAVVDTGMAGSAPAIIKGLQALGVEPRKVGLVILTHGHDDHCGSAATLCEATGARLVVHQADKEWVEQGTASFPPGVTTYGRFLSNVMGVAQRLAPNALLQSPPCHVDISVGQEGLVLGDFGIPGRIIPTPGHTPGSMTILLDSGEAFVGDQAMNGLPFCLRPSLPIFAMDLPAVKESWRSLLRQRVRTIYPGHGAPFPAENMRRFVS